MTDTTTLGITAAAVVIGLLVLAWAWSRRHDWLLRLEGARTRRTLRRLGREYMEDAVIPDGLDSSVVVDFLVLVPGGILVVDLKDYPGILFAGERIDEWTQTVGRRSYKFPNPIAPNQFKVQAVSDQVPEVPVHGRVVFTRRGRFATALPWSVSTVDSLAEDVADLREGDEVPGSYYSAWLRLRRALEGEG
ncbi:Nuclease-related domain-containing protein [Thiohalospira halophila DSM 15071]|uniref:Nuclease-related domain-containing protein n=1 Tax=Thiohalospira halophila DSM 15071 TaxID=1123397 RepID=A0A1I1QKD3_9GAMM|nr:nuclease-related domain-containing protein [Thiohalospira halophila]SFD22581.1 Nuclease-related domain-containing protein [Thiohalospira halophila DSM 15071]